MIEGSSQEKQIFPLHDIFPNELIRAFLSHLSFTQLVNVSRISALWGYLVGTLVKEMIALNFPYLITKKALNALSISKSIMLFKKQNEIYEELAKRVDLPSAFLQRNKLGPLLEAMLKDKEIDSTGYQFIFLKAFGVASEVNIPDVEYIVNNKSLLLMARIGNLEKLKKWFEENGVGIEQGSRYLDKDFGTSKSPKSTRNARS